MKLPTRVRAHELHPDGVYQINIGGLDLVWSIATSQQIPGLPFLADTDHWYRDSGGPPVFAAAQAASELTFTDLAAGGNFQTIAGLINQNHGPILFTSPATPPPGEFKKASVALPGAPQLKAFVLHAKAGETLDEGKQYDRLGIMVLPGAGNDPQAFRLAFFVPGAASCNVSFGPKIVAPNKFNAIPHGDPGHPYSWPDVRVMVIP